MKAAFWEQGGIKQYLQNVSDWEARNPSSKLCSTLLTIIWMRNMEILSLPHMYPSIPQSQKAQVLSMKSISLHFHHKAEINFTVLPNCMARKPQSTQKIRNLWEQYNCPCLACAKPNRYARSHHQKNYFIQALVSSDSWVSAHVQPLHKQTKEDSKLLFTPTSTPVLSCHNALYVGDLTLHELADLQSQATRLVSGIVLLRVLYPDLQGKDSSYR